MENPIKEHLFKHDLTIGDIKVVNEVRDWLIRIGVEPCLFGYMADWYKSAENIPIKLFSRPNPTDIFITFNDFAKSVIDSKKTKDYRSMCAAETYRAMLEKYAGWPPRQPNGEDKVSTPDTGKPDAILRLTFNGGGGGSYYKAFKVAEHELTLRERDEAINYMVGVQLGYHPNVTPNMDRFNHPFWQIAHTVFGNPPPLGPTPSPVSGGWYEPHASAIRCGTWKITPTQTPYCLPQIFIKRDPGCKPTIIFDPKWVAPDGFNWDDVYKWACEKTGNVVITQNDPGLTMVLRVNIPIGNKNGLYGGQPHQGLDVVTVQVFREQDIPMVFINGEPYVIAPISGPNPHYNKDGSIPLSVPLCLVMLYLSKHQFFPNNPDQKTIL